MKLERLWKLALVAAGVAFLLQFTIGWAAPLLHSFFHFLAMAGG